MTPSLQNVVLCSDGIHCGDCPHLKPYGDQYDLTAKCDLMGKDLMWYDYWLAECSIDESQNNGVTGVTTAGRNVT